jgi:hypothetical protein
MAIALEFIDLIVPISKIRDKYPGGWEACLNDHAHLIGGRAWYDEHLFRDGAMNPNDIRLMIQRWTSLGFETIEIKDGHQVWKDLCIVEGLFGGPTLPCDWLEFDPNQRIAYLKGFPPGPVVGREQSVRLDIQD